MLAFIPVDRAGVVVAPDGALAAIQEPTRVTLVALPRAEPFGVIATDTGAGTTDVGWIGSPPRLLVVARLAAGTRVRVVDPRAPRLVAERMLEPGLHLRACVDEHALLSSETDAVFVSCTDDELVARPFRARVIPQCAGAAHARLVVVSGPTILEIDPATGASKRTWRLEPGAAVTALGGSERLIWRTSSTTPNRIDVIPLIAANQPKVHELPEPIAQVAGHPRSDLLACLTSSGRAFLVDLSGAQPVRPLPFDHAEALGLVLGVEPGVIATREQRSTLVVPLAMPTWRDELVAWTRSGVVDRIPLVPALERLVKRLDLDEGLLPAVTLCYGAYLCGAPGVPPDELAEMLSGVWPDEVSGQGLLAATGILVFTPDWISLAPAYCQVLDEL